MVGYCKNKVTQSSFIKDQARLNKRHLETSNLRQLSNYTETDKHSRGDTQTNGM